MTDRSLRCDVVVVGAGTIGLAAAWRLARAGLDVVVADPDPGRGASWAAAGMLAPVTEVHYGEEDLLALNLASAKRWAAFADELAADGGPVGYRRTGTLLVAADPGDRAWAEQLLRYQLELGLDAVWVSARQARDMEPNLAPALRGGVWASGDHQVDNRALVGALLTASRARGVDVVARRVERVDTAGGAVDGAVLDDGTVIAARSVVLAAGCHSPLLAGLPEGAVPPVRPVKGQILRLAPVGPGSLLTRTVRGLCAGSSVYLVPRADGSVVVGATVEERGFDTTVTAGALYELLRDARRVVPGVAELTVADATAGLRPGSPDNGPTVGPSHILSGLVLAVGHYRNGILLAPLTADAVVAAVTGSEAPAELAPFRPGRFSTAGSPTAGSPTAPGLDPVPVVPH